MFFLPLDIDHNNIDRRISVINVVTIHIVTILVTIFVFINFKMYCKILKLNVNFDH